MYRFYSTGKNRVTIVAEIRPDGAMAFAAARCASNDNFNRKRGRTIAEGRLRAGRIADTIPRLRSTIPSGQQFVQHAIKLATLLEQNPDLVVRT